MGIKWGLGQQLVSIHEADVRNKPFEAAHSYTNRIGHVVWTA